MVYPIIYRVSTIQSGAGFLASTVWTKTFQLGEAYFNWVNEMIQLTWTIDYLVAGWATPLKNDGVSNSWDDEIPNFLWKVIKP